MTTRSITGILLIVTALVWALWDVYAWLYGIDSTISVMITDLSYKSIPFTFLMGFLMGHWFFPAKRTGE